jgi:tryptophanyl-tRNA synthetase
MPKEITEVVNSYLLVDLEEFSTLLEGGVPEGYSVQLEQVGDSGLHGPRMKLSKSSHLKVTLVNDSEKTAFQKIREFQKQNHDLQVEHREDGTAIVYKKE